MSLNDWKPENNYSVCVRETILQPWDCCLSAIVTDGKDAEGLQLEKVGQCFQVLTLNWWSFWARILLRLIVPSNCIADLLVFKEVHYPQVKAIENCICEVLTRKKQTYCDLAHFNFPSAVWEFPLCLQLWASNKMGSGLAAVRFEPTPPNRLVPKISALDHSAMLPVLKTNYTDFCIDQ